MGEYYIVERLNSYQIVRSLKGKVDVSQEFENVKSLGRSKAIVRRGGKYALFDIKLWEIGIGYDFLDFEDVYKNKAYLIYKLGGSYGVVDEDGNEIISSGYTFIQFINMAGEEPIIIGLRLAYDSYNRVYRMEDLFNIRGELHKVSQIIRGREYFIIGNKVYVKDDSKFKKYTLRGEEIRNGGKR